jgi:hypothetical protein
MMGSFLHWSLPSSDGTRGSCSSDFAHEEVSTDSFALRLGARRMRYALRPAIALAEGHAGGRRLRPTHRRKVRRRRRLRRRRRHKPPLAEKVVTASRICERCDLAHVMR